MSDDKNTNSNVSPELIGMSKEEAFKYLELSPDANDFELDDKFWQLSKRIRNIEDQAEMNQKMTDLSYAYDVATGKEEARLKALAEREAAKKYFGRTAEEWKVYFGYTWYKYLIAIVAIIAVGMICYRVFFTPDEDIAVMEVGHFEADAGLMELRLKQEGFKNPYCTCVDYVAPNSEGVQGNMYNEMTATVLFTSNPEVIITDTVSYGYCFGQFADMEYFYEELKNELPVEVFTKITPVYYSEYEAVKLSVEYQENSNTGEVDRSELDTASQEQILIGIKITDQEAMERLGLRSLWKQEPKDMIIGLGTNGDNRTGGETVIRMILSELA